MKEYEKDRRSISAILGNIVEDIANDIKPFNRGELAYIGKWITLINVKDKEFVEDNRLGLYKLLLDQGYDKQLKEINFFKDISNKVTKEA